MGDVVGYVAVGTNVGDREANLRAGIAGMADLGIAPARRSSVWETEPVGTVEPQWFLNMVVQIRSSQTPLKVLETLLKVERRVGRIRNGVRNAPRVLDLDLLMLGDARIESARLTLPHPRMWERRFVLCPLVEIAPGLRDPVTGRTVREILDRIDDGFEVRPAIIRCAESTGLEHPGR